MKFIYSYNTKQNERREGLTIRAPNRDAAFSELNRRGIRPSKLYPAPGIVNKLSGIGWRGFAIIVLAVALLSALSFALFLRKDIAQLERDEDVREIVSEAITSKVRRQIIGDQGVIEKGIRTGWSEVFDHEGERFLASFAIPGVSATVRTTNVAALEEAIRRKVEPAEGDGMEARQIKAMVEGMKDELRRFIAAGGTIEQYGRRLVARQDSEIAIFTRTSNEIEQAVRHNLGKNEIAELVDHRNEELRRMGIRLVQMPEIAD
ncbi:MAG: hypothetical protein K6G91_13870 [Kiritimatiellae bacterium]|nr:hypothetical protein [Kiritimatiellia bacterium]